jgi:hypothetical protein
MQASYSQSSFMSGEWSKAMQGRADHSEYRKAMATCLNGVVIESEAWTRRPGVLTGGTTRLGQAALLRKFDFEESAFYQMEFSNGFIRFWLGLQRVTNNDSQAIVGISAATPAVVTTAQPHGWTTGRVVFFTGLSSVAPLLQNRAFLITVLSPTTFSITDELTNAQINGAVANWTGGGTVNAIAEIPTSYIGGSWATVRVIQAETQAILLNGSHPQILTATVQPGATNFAQFAMAPSNWIDGPYLDPFPGSQAQPSGLQGNISLTFGFQTWSATYSYSLGDYVTASGTNYKSLQNGNLNNTPSTSPTWWTVVTGGDPIGPNGFVQSDVGRHIRLYSEPPLWSSGTAYVTQNVVSYNTGFGVNLYFIAIASSTNVIPGTDVTKWNLVAGAAYAVWTWGRILAVSGVGVISGATGTAFGDLTQGGGVAAAFDGNTAQSSGTGAVFGQFSVGIVGYVGKNYGVTPQQIAQATVYPLTDLAFGWGQNRYGNNYAGTVTLNLRASNTLPMSSSNGNLLGTTGAFANVITPQTINSSDPVTMYQYVWIEIVFSPSLGGTFNTACGVSEIVFFQPNVSNGTVVTMQVAGPPLLYGNPVRTWRLGVYSDTTGWPTCGTYHEGRLWLAGSIPNRFDATVANDLNTFSPTEPDGTVTDANGLSYVLNASDVNVIFWMAARQEGIVCGTQAGEWLIQATSQNAPLTPTSIQAHRYTKIKCANIEPAEAEHTLCFVQKHRKRLMEYFADIFSGKFSAPNVMFKSMHISQPGIAEIRYQHDQVPVVWMRMSDGSFAGVSYKRDSLMSRDGPSLAAAHRHQLGSGRTVVSLSVGPDGTGGELEALSFVTFDQTYYYVEVMAQVFAENDALSSAQFLDGSIIASSYVDNGPSCTFNGLWLLNGQTVEVFAGGLDCGAFPVVNGSVTVPYGDGIGAGTAQGLFTESFVNGFAGAMPTLIGYTYLSQGQLLSPDNPQEAGTRQGPAFGTVKRSHRIKSRFVNAVTGAVSFGTDLTKTLKAAFFKIKNGPAYTQQQLFSGVYKETLTDLGDPLESRIAWTASGPFPCTICRLGASVDSEDE